MVIEWGVFLVSFEWNQRIHIHILTEWVFSKQMEMENATWSGSTFFKFYRYSILLKDDYYILIYKQISLNYTFTDFEIISWMNRDS